MKPVAFSLIRSEPHYRRDAFAAGLAAAGYEVRHTAPERFAPGDLLLIWSRYGPMHDLAVRAEASGIPVLVAENAYIWTGGISPHHLKDRPAYALARGYHNDAGTVQSSDPSRWHALGVNLAPWRASGGHVLVAANRSFGTPGRIQPVGWAEEVAARLRKLTRREVRIRPHPGNDAPRKPLAEDLAGAWATVIWSSSAGIHSLIAGVPVICEAPFWICKQSAMLFSELDSLDSREEAPDASVQFCEYYGRLRQRSMECLAWAQWSLAEIEAGLPFKLLLRTTEMTV